MTNSHSQNTVDLSPSKETYRAVRADVTPRSAIRELIDNAIDNWQRLKKEGDELIVEVVHLEPAESEFDTEELIIRDNSGGLEEENLEMFFALGESTKGEIEGSVGAFGMGAKKACAYLGNTAEFRTNYEDNEGSGYGFIVDEEWLNSEEWEVEQRSYDDIEPGQTEVRIRDLNFNWQDLTEGYSEEEEKEATGENPTLVESLEETYEMYLGGGVKSYDYDFTLLVDGEELEAPDSINWSFCPLDDYYPRRFEGFKIDAGEDSDELVTMNISVGLLRRASVEDSGTDIFCQRRKVLSTDTGEEGGFGSGKYKLGNFGTGQKRLRIVVELETKGDAQNLPWDTQKSDINQYDPVAQEMYKYLRRATREYYQATYSKFPMTIVRPYGPDSPYAIKGEDGGVKTYDYSGRERVTDKPDTSIPEIKHVMEVAEAHAALGIECDDEMEQKQVPAYQEHLKWAFTEKEHLGESYKEIYGTLKRISTAPPTQLVNRLERGRDIVDNIAEEHAAEGIRWTGIPEWASRYYEYRLEEYAAADISEFNEVDTLEETPDLIPQPVEQGEDISEEPDTPTEESGEADTTSAEGLQQDQGTSDTDAASSSLTVAGPDMDTSDQDSQGTLSGTSQPRESSTPSSDETSMSPTTASNNISTRTDSSEDDSSPSPDLTSPSDASVGGSPRTERRHHSRSSDNVIELDTLRDILDVSEDADEEDITEEISELVNEIEELRKENEELREELDQFRSALEDLPGFDISTDE